MEPMDLIRALNDAATMDQGEIDKSQVYRWLKGQLPHGPTLMRIAATLDLTDPTTGEPNPEMLMAHPAQDWITMKLQGRSRDEVERLKSLIELALPDRTGTEG